MLVHKTYENISMSTWRQHLASQGLDHYAGILSMHGIARLARIKKSDEILNEAKAAVEPFWKGEVEKAGGVFGDRVYRWGGNATAFLVARGVLPEAKDSLIKAAESLCKDQPRDSRGTFHMPGGNRKDGSEGFIWIDTVFGVCPFLLWAGLVANRQDFIDESAFQMVKHHEVLFNKSRGLYHQAINFNKPDELTPSFWSRGCGWGALALAELVYDLPKDHKDYDTILAAYRDLMTGCREHMDENGMLHQAMEDRSTYVETSGTALVLYAMARGLKNKSLAEDEFKDAFLKGLKGVTRYVAVDGSVFNCCQGCLAPENGTAEDYNNMPWVMNDTHSFGPMILLFAQAEQLQNIGMIPTLEEL